MNEEKNVVNEIKATLGKTTALVVSFDSTGSMQSCIQKVRQQLRNLVESMTQDIPNLKIGLIAHGDYCDGANAIKVLDLTSDLEAIMNFITNTPNTGGGDAPECYELALNRARSLSWPEEGGAFILIGDDEPHDPNYPQNTDHLDWRQEVRALKEKNVSVFPLQCLKNKARHTVNKFWEEVSGEGNTPLLLLEDFEDSANVLEAVAYAATTPEDFGTYEAKAACKINVRNMAENVGKLKEWQIRNVRNVVTPTSDVPNVTADEKTE